MYRAFQHLAVIVALLLPAALAAQQRDGNVDNPEVTDLRIRGARALDKNEIEESIAISESKCRGPLYYVVCLAWKHPAVYEREYYDRSELKRDVLRIQVLYYKRGYREAKVDTAVVEKDGGKEIEVTFTIVEGPPTLTSVVRVRRAEGLLSARSLRRLVLLRAGDPFDLLLLDSTLVRLKQAMWEQGYADAILTETVDAPRGTRTARVEITVDPRPRATVGKIVVDGNAEIEEQTIRNSLTFKSGDIFRLTELTESQRNLYESNLFRRATIGLVPPPDDSGKVAEPDSVKDVLIGVTEAPPREARLASGINTREFLQVEGRYTHYNWFGAARRLDVQGSLGNLLAPYLNNRAVFSDITTVAGADRGRFLAPTWQASADLRQRWFGSPRNTIGTSVFAHRRATPGIFIDRGYGASAAFTREIGMRAPASANYRFEITRVEASDVYFCVSYGVCDSETISALRGNQRLSPLLLTGQWDRTDTPIGPRRGFNLRGELEHASTFTISDFRYNRTFAEGMVYRPVGRGGTLAAKLRLGRVKALKSTAAATGAIENEGDVLHPRKRFYAGGSQSVRGFGENQLGPRVLTIPAEKLRSSYAIVSGDTVETCAESVAIATCDPNVSSLENRDFTPRAMGGNALLEGSVEYRLPFPILQGALVGAVFIDGAFVGAGAFRDITSGMGAVTPGFGVRYRSPVGPIRVDVGYQPLLSERLTVITESVDATGRRTLVRLEDASGALLKRTFENRGIWNRFTLHFSIGEAF